MTKAGDKPQDLRIRIKYKPRRLFQMRIAGLAFRDGHVLIHRGIEEEFWTFPGGRAEMGETSETTLKREMVEELGVEAEVGRLLWVVENFFHYEDRDYHELGFYYLMSLPETFPFHPSDIVHTLDEDGKILEFRWVQATREALLEVDVPPYFIAGEIENLPEQTRHLVWDDRNLDSASSRETFRR